MNKITKENYGAWAAITGASSGVGKEMVYEIASKGLNLVLIARNEHKLNEISDDIRSKFDIEIKVLIADLSKTEAIEKVISECKNLEVGLLINCAGYALSGEFLENSLEDELAMLNVNVEAPLMLTHHFSKAMKERGKGGIMFVSSIMALAGASGWASYNASKSHNLLLAEGLGEELRKSGVNVIALTPGSIRSGFQERSGTKSMVAALHPRRVARCGLWMLGCKKRTHTAGFMNKLIAFSTRLTPRSINTKIFSFVVKQLKKA